MQTITGTKLKGDMSKCKLKEQEAWLTTHDQIRLHYKVSGSGPVDYLLFDGIGCDGFIWSYIKPYLEETGRVIHLHMRGHGQSDNPSDLATLNIDYLISDWMQLLDLEKITQKKSTKKKRKSTRPIVGLAHSMGVQVALELRGRTPQLPWTGLIMMCGTFEHTATNLYDNSMIERVLPLLNKAAQIGGSRLHRVWQKMVNLPLAVHVARATEMSADLTRKRDIERYLSHLGRMQPKVFLTLLQNMSQHSCRAVLSDIDTPTLVIAGQLDHFTPPRLSIELDHLLLDSELLMLEEGTHSAPIEQTIEVNQCIRRFLAERIFETNA